MKSVFCHPTTNEPLIWRGDVLTSGSGTSFTVKNGIPNLIFPVVLDKEDQRSKNFYEGRAAQYDNTIHLTFYTVNEDEVTSRNTFIDKLDLKPDSKVLEIACGTGRDSCLIADRLTTEGELHMSDLSEDMLSKCVEKLKDKPLTKSFCLANASYLPYPDKYFDATYSFGAMGEFPDKKKALKEMVRVTRPGGKIVFGDESIPTWHRETEFYKILRTTNYMFEEEVPFKHLPVEARNVNVKWVIGGTFYLLDLVVGEGEPTANFDYEIPGVRGGTYRTRYEGQLEGVDPNTKQKAWDYVKSRNLNMHEWLRSIINKELDNQK